MHINMSCIDDRELLKNLAMESSRLSDDSTDRESESTPMFGENTSTPNEPERVHFSRKRSLSNEDNDYHDEDEVNLQPPPKKFMDIGQRLMQKMGYSEGKGLGKYGQGILQPVEASNQKGRRGIGHHNVKLTEATLKWDPTLEIVSVEEDMEWLSSNQEVPVKSELSHWLVLDSRKETIDNETLFCDPQILHQIINSKSIFDELDKHEMLRARTRSNPFETIRGVFFQNRAAVKMANLDKACNFIFTNPNIYDRDEPLYFADVCAGPGGFSEYILWRKRWHAKGFGFTLKETNDFKLDEFYAGSPETFHPYYGPKEDGNVYDPDNQKAFRRLIMSQTKGLGVHFMMADGGFSVEGQENIQEILSKQLYLCQCLVALMIVREGGSFVTKLFDLFTPFSAGLLYLMYRCFERVCIFKPNTSRPANSERYLICQNKLANTEDIVDYLNLANHLLLKNDKSRDVMELVPLEILQGDENFYKYLKDSNESLGRKQIVGLIKIAAFCEDSKLIETRQAEMRKNCLIYWDLPDQTRSAPKFSKVENRLQLILGSSIKIFESVEGIALTRQNIKGTILNSPCDWYCVLCDYDKSSNYDHLPTFYFGMGRTKVFRLVQGAWERILTVELPPDTLVYAEIVKEFRGQYKTQRKTEALHIIDAWLLGGEDISNKYLTERHALINKFCDALWKPENSTFCRVRPKNLHSLDDDLMKQLKLEPRIMKNGINELGHYPDERLYARPLDRNEEPFFFIPRCVMFFKSTMLPWSLHLSRNTGQHYFFNSKTGDNFYNDKRPDSVTVPFSKTLKERIVWHWFDDKSISIQYICDQINMKCPKQSKNR